MQSIYCLSCGQPNQYTCKKPIVCGHCATLFDKSVKALNIQAPNGLSQPQTNVVKSVIPKPSTQTNQLKSRRPGYNFVEDDEIEDINPDMPLNLKREDIVIEVQPIQRQTIGQLVDEESQLISSRPATRGRPKKSTVSPMSHRDPTSHESLLAKMKAPSRIDIGE